MANKITRTMKERTVNVLFMTDDCDLKKAVAVMHGNKVNYSEIAKDLNINANNICEVEVTDNFTEYKTEMDTTDFILNAIEVTDGKRKPGYFYRTIKTKVYTYKAYDISEKKLVDIQTTKERKIGKIIDGLKYMKLLKEEVAESMFAMSDEEWIRLATIE